MLRNKRQFHHVEWEKLRDEVRMSDLRQKLRRWRALHIEMEDDDQKEHHNLDNLGQLQKIKSKVEALRAAGKSSELLSDDASNFRMRQSSVKRSGGLLSDAKNK